jgi:type II restriction enzyme
LASWKRTLFLREGIDGQAKGWLLDVMNCIDKIGSNSFTLEALYAFENALQRIYPRNRHVRDKIRQQLQVLRHKGYLEFAGRGTYRLTPPD